jgi:hypothetical protein
MSMIQGWLLGLSILGVTSFCIAGIRTIKSLNSFEHSIDRNDYIVVFVYEQKKDNLGFKRIDEMFERLSHKADYVDAQVTFLKINKKNIATIMKDYVLSELPAFFILKKGRLIGSDSSRAVLYGYPTRLELTSFIDEWIGSEIDSIVQAEKDRRQHEEERDQSRSNVSVNYDVGLGYSPDYYWDWPYYRPGYYYGGWGWRHRGWGWGHRGWGHRGWGHRGHHHR